MRAPKQEILYQEKIFAPKKFVRFATPADVARYRAERLKCNTIVDLGAGIGGQTIAFAETCKKVIAVEIHPEQIEILKKNIEILGIKNVEIIIGNALDEIVIKKIKAMKPDIVFCDTERAEKGKRSIDELKPDIWKLIEEYSKITEKIAIEIPPFISDLNRLKEEYEKEFISLNGKLNRLTIYLRKLKKCEKSAVSLPSKSRIENKNAKKIEITTSAVGFNYLYTIDPSIFMAELLNELGERSKVKLIEMDKKGYFLSKEKIDSPFMQPYKILDVCDNNFDEIIKSLKKLNAKSVVIRYSVLPAEYWKERKKYEERLDGNKKVHLFINKEAIICESLRYKQNIKNT
ncbi:MAG: class I SAM-dependent methyltransferase [Candidatus Pacearchaeota archaeon]